MPLWKRLVQQFRSPLIYVLLFALAVDLGIWIFEAARGPDRSPLANSRRKCAQIIGTS